MRKSRILIIGEVCREIDISNAGPLNKEIITADAVNYNLGGNGVLTSAILTHYGSDTVLCSKIGKDTDGRFVSKYVSSGGVSGDTRFVVQDENTTTPVHVKITSDDGNHTIISRKKDYGIGKEEIGDAFISYPDVVCLLDCINPWGYRETAEQISSRGGRLFILSSPDNATLHHFSSCEVLSLSEEEASNMTGYALKDQESCMRACMSLEKHIKAQFMVLRLGDRGYFISDGTFYSFVPSYDLPIKDKAECDTVFLAIFLHAYVNGEMGIKESCEYASAGVAVFVTRGGNSIPSEKEIEAFISRNR